MVSPVIHELLQKLLHEIEELSRENASLKDGKAFEAQQVSKPDGPMANSQEDFVAIAADLAYVTVGEADNAKPDGGQGKSKGSGQSDYANFVEDCRGPIFSQDTSSMELSRVSSLTSMRTADLDERPRLVRLVDSPEVDVVTTAMIMINTIVYAVESQYAGVKTGYVLGIPGYTTPPQEYWIGADVFFIISERVFTLVFTLELIIRIAVLRREFLKQPSNLIDIFAVGFSLVDWVLSANVLLVNPMLARVLRFARFTRLLRIIKYSRRLGALRLFIRSIIASGATLSLSLMVLVLLQCIAAVGFSFMVADFVHDENKDMEARREVFAFYGTFSRIMITMFEIHFANFAPACRVLVDHVGEIHAYVFIMYRCIVGFAILNVINAVFIQQTLAIAQQEHDQMLEKEEKAAEKFERDLKRLFERLDSKGTGKVSFDELRIAVETEPAMKYWMSALEIGTHDLENLFQILDKDGDQNFTYEEFTSAASRIRGTAKSLDLVTLLEGGHGVKQLHKKVEGMKAKIDGLGRQLGRSESKMNSGFNEFKGRLVKIESRETSPEEPLRRHSKRSTTWAAGHVSQLQDGAPPPSMQITTFALEDEPMPLRPFVNKMGNYQLS